MANLMLHCGAKHVPRTAVEKAFTPQASASWVPVPHHRLLEQVESTLAGSGLTIVNQAHALWQDGQRYFGLMEVTNGQDHADYGLVVGLRNSHDKTFPAAIALGSVVLVCDNLAFSAEVTIARRHTRFIVTTMGLKPSPSGESFRFYDLLDWRDGELSDGSAQSF